MSKINKFPARAKAPAPLDTPTDLSPEAVEQVAKALNGLVADTYALYFKTKNFHWHVSGPHFRDYHLLFDEQAKELFETTDDLAERVRKIGGATLRSIGHISRLQRVHDNDQDFVPPCDMLRELMADNKAMMTNLREAHAIAEKHGDIGTSSMLEVFIDGAEKRNWFLFEASRQADQTGH
jgi:starvation-inducible DNA-binding protein